MIDVLYNKLPASNNASLIEWNNINPCIYNKHSQNFCIKEKELVLNTIKEPIIDDVVVIIPKVTEKKNVLNTIKESIIDDVVVIIPKVTEKKNVLNKYKPAISKKKDETIKPLNIIINETTSFNNSTEYIKDTLVKMISTEEFSKIFGLTKCAEIMSGIVNNRWNKSTALFISFLLDKEIYYNDKLMIYNKEKNIGRITIAKL
jgi:hypothetical protein